MSQVVIDTDKIWSEIRVPLAIIVVIAIIIIAGITLYDKGWADAATAQTAASAPVATVIAQPTAIPAPAGRIPGFLDRSTGDSIYDHRQREFSDQHLPDREVLISYHGRHIAR